MDNEQIIAGQLGVSQKDFDGEVFVIKKQNVLQARILMARIAKVLGGPFLKLFSLDISEDDGDLANLDFGVFSSALASVDPEESVMVIKELCELTINQSKGRPTNYIQDFLPSQSKDLEVAFWVAQEQFGDFFTGLVKSGLGVQALNLVPSKENT